MAVTARNPSISFESMALKPPLHPTYDLKGIINLALAEDAGGQGLSSLISSSIVFVQLPSQILMNPIFEPMSSDLNVN